MTADSTSTIHGSTFHTTRWTRVCLAKADSDDGRRALAELCEAYYEPVVTFLSCELRDADTARDLGHAFFAEILKDGKIFSADSERGRFRSYLLGAVKHFLSRKRQAARRLKRGAGAQIVSIDDAEVADIADVQILTPDTEFDRQWAVTVLARGMAALRLECVNSGRVSFFETVTPFLSGNADHGEQAALAAACGMNPEAFRVAVNRMKRRLRQCVKAEVAGTLENPASIEDEMQTLFAALRK